MYINKTLYVVESVLGFEHTYVYLRKMMIVTFLTLY